MFQRRRDQECCKEKYLLCKSWSYTLYLLVRPLILKLKFMEEKSGGLACVLYSVVLSKGFELWVTEEEVENIQ